MNKMIFNWKCFRWKRLGHLWTLLAILALTAVTALSFYVRNPQPKIITIQEHELNPIQRSTAAKQGESSNKGQAENKYKVSEPRWPYSNLSHLLTPNCSLTSELLQFTDRVQTYRKEQLQKTCKEKQNFAMDITNFNLERILVDDQHKMLYCIVPKAGCTNWMKLFTRKSRFYGRKFFDAKTKKLLSPDVHAKWYLQGLGLKYLANYSNAEIHLRVKSYHKFLFVRDPLERLLSAYREKFTLKNKWSKGFHLKYGRYIIEKYRPNASNHSLVNGDDVTFSEFIQYLTDIVLFRDFNPHWAPYHTLCHPCHISYDYIGKTETMDVDALPVLSKFGPIDCDYTQSPKSHVSNPPTHVLMERYYGNITSTLRKKLLSQYKLDFALFGYEIPEMSD